MRSLPWVVLLGLLAGIVLIAGDGAAGGPVGSAARLLGLSGAEVVTQATSTDDDDEDRFYFYRITEPDGAASVEEMTRDDAHDLREELDDEYRKTMKDWGAGRKAWYKLVGRKKYPVPPPKRPEVRRLGRVPSNPDRAHKEFEARKRKLDVWRVCFVKDWEGKPSVQVLRSDRVFAAQVELWRGYAEAVMDVMQARKEGVGGEADEVHPVAPALAVKHTFKSAETAERVAEKYSEKLAQKAAAEAEKREREEAERERAERAEAEAREREALEAGAETDEGATHDESDEAAETEESDEAKDTDESDEPENDDEEPDDSGASDAPDDRDESNRSDELGETDARE